MKTHVHLLKATGDLFRTWRRYHCRMPGEHNSLQGLALSLALIQTLSSVGRNWFFYWCHTTGAPCLWFIITLRRTTGHFLSTEMLLVQSHYQPLYLSQTTNKNTTVLQERNLSSQNLAVPKASSKSREQTCSCLGLIFSCSSLSTSHPAWGCWVLRLPAGQR